VRWQFRFQLSLRDIKELLFERGVTVTYAPKAITLSQIRTLLVALSIVVRRWTTHRAAPVEPRKAE